MNSTHTGQKIEQIVCQNLEKQSWTILKTNYRRPGCEIDIIAEKMNTLIFLEVKYRKLFGDRELNIAELLPTKKQTSLKKGALLFLESQNRTWDTMRHDLILVTKKSPTNKLSFTYFLNILN